MNNDQPVLSILNNVTAHNDIHKGLPPLTSTEKSTSFFEFWPTLIIYTPAILYWIWLTLKYRHPTLPLCANPSFHLGGMVGEKKSDIFKCAGAFAKQHIAVWIKITNTAEQCDLSVKEQLISANLSLPLVAKPDIGCRGAGVKLLKTQKDLESYLNIFPKNEDFLLQELIPHEGEAGIFYVRLPSEKKGRIFSMAFKYQAYIFGNGKDTLKTLIGNDARARHLSHIYYERHKDSLDKILTEKQAFRLGFAGSHSRGAIFRDARQYITPELEESIDKISQDIKGFNYGRFDVRFKDVSHLQKGKNFTVIEVNGASSEAIHIWDAGHSLKDAISILCQQFQLLFAIGYENHKAGATSLGLMTLLRSWLKERRLSKKYPITD